MSDVALEKLVIIGFGIVGKGALPLILKHVNVPKNKIIIIDPQPRPSHLDKEVQYISLALNQDNYQEVLHAHLGQGGFLLNLSTNVSSISLVEWCQNHHVPYLDTCIEPWENGYTDINLPMGERTNESFRYSMFALKNKLKGASSRPTATITHGANPGLVSHFVKQALINMAKEQGLHRSPKSRSEWAQLAKELDIKCIHIAERDTQWSNEPKKVGEFVNTWSIDGFISEGSQPSEMGWGEHEKSLPKGAQKLTREGAVGVYLNRPGARTLIKSWTPHSGPMHGFLVTHSESISIADYFSVYDAEGKLTYRPTTLYAYHPSNDPVLSLHEFAGNGLVEQPSKRILMDDIVDGFDELGVLLMGNEKGSYWYGSRLSIHEARELCPYNNATSLQVVAGVLGALIWTIENPGRGIVEPDEMNYDRVLEVASPYLGKMFGVWSTWTPTADYSMSLFPGNQDLENPWSLMNFLVA